MGGMEQQVSWQGGQNTACWALGCPLRRAEGIGGSESKDEEG